MIVSIREVASPEIKDLRAGRHVSTGMDESKDEYGRVGEWRWSMFHTTLINEVRVGKGRTALVIQYFNVVLTRMVT